MTNTPTSAAINFRLRVNITQLPSKHLRLLQMLLESAELSNNKSAQSKTLALLISFGLIRVDSSRVNIPASPVPQLNSTVSYNYSVVIKDQNVTHILLSFPRGWPRQSCAIQLLYTGLSSVCDLVHQYKLATIKNDITQLNEIETYSFTNGITQLVNFYNNLKDDAWEGFYLPLSISGDNNVIPITPPAVTVKPLTNSVHSEMEAVFSAQKESELPTEAMEVLSSESNISDWSMLRLDVGGVTDNSDHPFADETNQ